MHRVVLCAIMVTVNRRTDMKDSKAQILELLTEKEKLIMNNAAALEINAIDSLLNALMEANS
mgnify:CR=1 FL=1